MDRFIESRYDALHCWHVECELNLTKCSSRIAASSTIIRRMIWVIAPAAVLLSSCTEAGVEQQTKTLRTPVSSSAIRSVGYDEPRHTLEIEFNNGDVYEYFDVPEHVFNGLMNADSHGRYFHRHVRSASYRFRRVNE